MPEESSKFKNIGFMNYQWTEIKVEDDEECDEIEKEEVKRAIIQMSQRELNNSLLNNMEGICHQDRPSPIDVNYSKVETIGSVREMVERARRLCV